MARIGTIIGIERAKNDVFVVIRGIGKIEDGQILHFKQDSWTVVKKRWVKGEDASFLLKSPTGKVPEVGQKIELIIDDIKFTIEGGHALDVVDCFMLTYKDEIICAVTLYGLVELKKGDVIENDVGTSWKVVETSMTVSSVGVNKRFMVLIESLDKSQLIPQSGMKITKINTKDDSETNLNSPEASKSKKSNTKRSKNSEN